VALAVFLSRLRPIDPTLELRERAPRVAGLFPAAFVVMGHTHFPEVRLRVCGESTYVNLGCWAESEGDEHEPSVTATRTHLVVRVSEDGRSKGELLVWDAATGPRRYSPPEAIPLPSVAPESRPSPQSC
jgi:hypothetical protein